MKSASRDVEFSVPVLAGAVPVQRTSAMYDNVCVIGDQPTD
jgi:hypothetical protein